MGVFVTFMLLATVTPYLFLRLRKPAFAIVQSALLVGMWIYFFQVLLFTEPAAFSATWSMFYLSLVGAHVAWVMFIIVSIKDTPSYQESLKKEKETLPF